MSFDEKTAFIMDTTEITNAITKLRDRKGSNVLLPLLFDPEYIGPVRNDLTGESYQSYKLKNLDMMNIVYEVRPLMFGDYIIQSIDELNEPVIEIIERKTMNDLISSFTTSMGKGEIHLKKEIDKAIKGTELYDNARVNLLIEDFYECRFDFSTESYGVWTTFKKSYGKKLDGKNKPVYSFISYSRRAIHPNAILSLLQSLENGGVNIIRCGGANHAYNIVMDMITKIPEEKRISIRALRRKPVAMEPNDNSRFILEGFPGVAGNLADSALAVHGSLDAWFSALSNAETAEQMRVRGFGKARFDAMKKIWKWKYAATEKSE